MARKKTADSASSSNATFDNIAERNLSEKLGEAFGAIIKRDFGQFLAPPPIVTPIGIKPLDYLLGGGIVSSKPVMISSTPETGKSTFCFQFSKIFQNSHENGVIVYLDIEGAGNAAGSESVTGTISRIVSFGLDLKTFQYQPVILTISGVFDLIEKLAAIKQAFEEQLKKEFYVLIIWDSISATRSSKTDLVEDHNQMIGFRARELTFKLERFSPLLAFKKFTLIIVDQVRANLKAAIDGAYAPKEKTVGDFKDFKSSTSINSLNHLTGQWLFFSKKKTITVADGMGIDGWEIDVLTEKNKNAPSRYIITCIFDKSKGFDKFWSEYKFMSEMCPSENKIYKKLESQLKYPLVIHQSGPMVTLKVVDELDHKKVLYKSNSMYRKNMKNEYDTNDEFRQWFDYAVELSCQHRIVNGLFKCEETLATCQEEDEIVSNLLPVEEQDFPITEEQEFMQEPVELY
jgi:RecA/RadA recombinase